MAGRPVRRDVSALIVGLLVISAALVALLAWQAHAAQRTHRQLAESVLRDYAELAAEELIRRATGKIGYYGCYPLVTALAATDEEAALPSPSTWRSGDAERLARAAGLARCTFRRVAGRAEIVGCEADAAFRAAVEVLPSQPDDEGERMPIAVHQFDDDGNRRLVFGFTATGEPIGFELDFEALRTWFDGALGEAPLLPPALVVAPPAGDLQEELAGTSDFVDLRVRTADGRVVFAMPGVGGPTDPAAPDLGVEVPFGTGYKGLFEGMTARAELDPRAAPRLLIGGLPRSRPAFLLALLGLTAGLLGAAAWMLRKDRALHRLRADFVSRVSHELRTPLAQIRLFTETLRLGRIRDDDEARRSLAIVDREARRLSHLVENILQFSRAERGQLELVTRKYHLPTWVSGQLAELQPLLGDTELAFTADEDGAGEGQGEDTRDPTVLIDPEAFRQVLLNLLDNAVKYGSPKGEIDLDVSVADGLVELSVDDTGPGIPRGQRERVWESYYRLERDRRSVVAGTGIGLAVVRELVELHGGHCRVERGRRGGARFVVAIPRVARPRTEAS